MKPTHRALSRRQFVRLSALSLAGASLAACGQIALPQFPSAEPSATPARPVRHPAGKAGTLKWLEPYSLLENDAGKPDVAWIDAVAAQFEAENEGWRVKRESVRRTLLDQKLLLDATAGLDHDVVFATPQYMPRHLKSNTFIDLHPYLAELDPAEQDDLNWNPAYRAGSQGSVQLCLPVGLHVRATMIRRDAFAEAGLDPARPIATLDALAEAAKKLTKADKDIWGLGICLGQNRAAVELAYAPAVWNSGGDFYDATDRKATLTSPAAVKAMQWLFDLVYTHKVVPPRAVAPDADYAGQVLQPFLDGKAALTMGFDGRWLADVQGRNLLKNCYPPKRDCQPDKAGVMVQPGLAQAQFIDGPALSIHRLSKNAGTAWLLLTTILAPDNLKTFPDAGFPARQTEWRRIDYDARFYQAWLEAVKSSRPMPAAPFYPELADAVLGALRDILVSKAAIEPTLKKYENDWNRKFGGQ